MAERPEGLMDACSAPRFRAAAYYHKYLLSVISGGLLALSFPKPDIYPLAWIALIPLLLSIRDAGPKDSFKMGLATGVAFNLASISWIINTMSVYGGLPVPVSLLLLLALSLYLALYFGLFSYTIHRLRSRLNLPFIITAPATWVALELLRNYMLTGFPWNLLGYSQHGFLSIIQIADITGVYGVSALILMVNAAVADVIYIRPTRFARAGLINLAIAAAIFVSVFGYGVYKLSHPPIETGRLKVSLIQGNIDQFHKWDPQFQTEVFDGYRRLTLEAAASKPDIIIWPETATPFIFNDPENQPKLIETAIKAGTFVMTGSPTVDTNAEGIEIEHNSAYLIAPDGSIVGRYDKMHLVPFGEYVPAKKLLPFVSRVVESIGDFGPGTEHTVLKAGRGRLGTAICYEVIFPDLVRNFPLNGANFLSSITNDAWFGDSGAPYQHFNMAALRAVENHRALVRAANTGITGIIMPDGSVASSTRLFESAALTGDIPLVEEMTFYTRHGDLFAYFCAVAAGLMTMVSMVNCRDKKVCK